MALSISVAFDFLSRERPYVHRDAGHSQRETHWIPNPSGRRHRRRASKYSEPISGKTSSKLCSVVCFCQVIVAQGQYADTPELIPQATSVVMFLQLLGSSVGLAYVIILSHREG